ncbi:repressor LexA, partial [Bosea sp. CER48]
PPSFDEMKDALDLRSKSGYVLLTRDIDLREAVREADPKLDLATAIPPCDTIAGVSGSRDAP